MPLTKPGRVRGAELLGGLDRLVDRHLRGHVGDVQELGERHAQDVALERRDPVERPALRVAPDQLVQLGPVALDGLHELARERPGVAVEQLLGRAAGHVRLVQGHGGGSSLVRAPHRSPA